MDWGLLYMFGGALSLGKLLTGTGADVAIGTLIGGAGISGTAGLVFVIVTFTLVMSDLTSNGATASMCLPITMSIASALGTNATPLLYITAIGINLSFTMPTSIRAIPVAVRAILKKMKIRIVEAENIGTNSVCCGDSLYPSCDKEKIFAAMKRRTDSMPCENVAVYCVSCVKAMHIGGKVPRHLVDLLLG